MMPKKWIKICLFVLLLMIGCSSAGKAVYMTTKAQAAQFLLNRAWTYSLTSDTAVKPWPWADIYPKAKLSIPRLGINQVVLQSHSGEAMAFGPGLVQQDNSFVLAGHRDSHFSFLQELQVGDQIILNLSNGQRREAIIEFAEIINIDKQPNISPLDNSIVLITCFPFDAVRAGGPLRYVMTAL